MTTEFDPFDLARAQAGEEVQFRGRDWPVRYNGVLRDKNGTIKEIAFVYVDEVWGEHQTTRHIDGSYWRDGVASPLDIVMKPKPKNRWWFQVWRNVDGSPRNNGVFYSTEEAVLKAQSEGSDIAFIDLPPKP